MDGDVGVRCGAPSLSVRVIVSCDCTECCVRCVYLLQVWTKKEINFPKSL